MGPAGRRAKPGFPRARTEPMEARPPKAQACKDSKLAYYFSFMAASRPRLDRQLGFLLADISRLARKEFDRRVRPLGLTRAQWLVLYYLGRQPGLTQRELADQLQLEKITVGRQAERLARAGWIERRDHREDRRAYNLHLTAKAARVVDRLDELASALREDYLRGLPPARRGALAADLALIKSNLVRLEDAAGR